MVFERIVISLVPIIASTPYPDEQELAAVLRQVDRTDMESQRTY